MPVQQLFRSQPSAQAGLYTSTLIGEETDRLSLRAHGGISLASATPGFHRACAVGNFTVLGILDKPSGFTWMHSRERSIENASSGVQVRWPTISLTLVGPPGSWRNPAGCSNYRPRSADFCSARG